MITALERRTPSEHCVFVPAPARGYFTKSESEECGCDTGGGGEVAAVARGITSLGGDFCGGGGGDGVLCSCRGGCEGGRGVGGGGGGGVYLLLEGTGEASRLILWNEEGRGVVEVK